tara:strand:+ start:25967 stop:26422 length:456 start_codon:yes stop_codon:yes gene_type:complete
MAVEPNDYAARVAEAEAAVKSVKDPELRRVAFEKVLEHLLIGGPPPSAPGGPKKRKRASTPRSTKRATKTGTSSSGKGPKARLVELIEEGYFKKQRTIAEVKAELANRGHHIPQTSLSGPLQTLTQDRQLRRQKVSTKGPGAKSTYAYSNW